MITFVFFDTVKGNVWIVVNFVVSFVIFDSVDLRNVEVIEGTKVNFAVSFVVFKEDDSTIVKVVDSFELFLLLVQWMFLQMPKLINL